MKGDTLMKKEDKVEALMIINKNGGTVNVMPTINGFIKEEYLGIIDCPHVTIKTLISQGYSLSMLSGILLVDKF